MLCLGYGAPDLYGQDLTSMTNRLKRKNNPTTTIGPEKNLVKQKQQQQHFQVTTYKPQFVIPTFDHKNLQPALLQNTKHKQNIQNQNQGHVEINSKDNFHPLKPMNVGKLPPHSLTTKNLVKSQQQSKTPVELLLPYGQSGGGRGTESTFVDPSRLPTQSEISFLQPINREPNQVNHPKRLHFLSF